MREILQFEAFDGKIFSTAQECMDYEKKFKENTYEIILRTNVILRIDELEIPIQVKCSDHLVKNDTYGIELASLTEENFSEIYGVEDLLKLAEKQNAKIYLDCLENSRATNPTLIKGED